MLTTCTANVRCSEAAIVVETEKKKTTPFGVGLMLVCLPEKLLCAMCTMQYGESVDVADWFSGFCAVHDSSGGQPQEEEAQPATEPKPKKRRGRPSKKVLQRVSPLTSFANVHNRRLRFRV